MLDAVVAAGLQHRQVAGKVGALVGEGVVDRVADAGLGGEVDDPLAPGVRTRAAIGLGVGDIGADHAESRARRPAARRAASFRAGS